jgi:iron uptake system component EfeO
MKLRTSGLPLGLLSLALVATASGCGSDKASSTGGDKAGGGPANAATVTITAADGCTIDHTSFAAGGIDFTVKNKDATAVTEVELLAGERIVGEKENLPPGFSGTFSVAAPAGDYTLYCPGASSAKTPIKVTGKADATDADTATLLKEATDGYATYVTTQVGYLVEGAQKLADTLHGTDLAAAQTAYAKARPYYEKIEPVAESFTVGKVDLDANIDARANDVPASQFMGFHRIEKGLFADKSLTGLADFGDQLVVNVKKLQTLTTGLTYQPTELANGAQELLDEAASSKISGEEERYSHIDLLDLANNDEGAEQAFAQLTPVLEKSDPALTKKIQERFAALDALVSTYRDAAEPSGYKLYDKVTDADRRKIAAAIKAVQEPLSQVASKVAG